MRQLIANGKSRTALENAKEFHKTQRSEASEALLLDAYAARIQSLLDQNLATEAKSLLELVCERFPAAKPRLDALKAGASAKGGDLAALLQPLNDPELSPDLRAAIEKIVETQITDLAALAACPALPAEHRLRQAAAALDQAFNLVTSGPVTAEQIALPEVSHRSPLAPWKLLIRAIACFHRGEDAECRECLAAINPESAARPSDPGHAGHARRPARRRSQTGRGRSCRPHQRESFGIAQSFGGSRSRILRSTRETAGFSRPSAQPLPSASAAPRTSFRC